MNKEQLPGLYLHVPFCRSKCFYCDFYSVASFSAIHAWLKAVAAEMLLYKERFPVFDSLYIGGGTPSVLEERDLDRLLDSLFGNFVFHSESEMSLEANPESLSKEKLKTMKDYGINRLSIGIQSLDDGELEYLGRRHSSNQAIAALDIARSAGFSNISVDLIYGTGFQTLSGWRKTLDRIVEFRPEHISCYQMTLQEGTLFWKMKKAGRIQSLGEKLESAFFILTSRHLERLGYQHYEISNFAAGMEFRCRHNLKYWSHAPYLGLGPSAHSFQEGSRWWNLKSVHKYCRELEGGRAPVEASEVLSREQLQLEKIDLGFRTSGGIDIEAVSGDSRSDKILAELQRSGLVKVCSGHVLPTRRGFLIADSLALMFSHS